MKKLGEKYKLLIVGAVLVVAVLYIKDILNIAAKLFSAFSPVFIGILFALILNIILNFYERKLFTFKKNKHKKLKRPLNLFMTYLTFLLIVGGLMAMAFPHIIRSLNALAEKIPGYIEALPEKIEKLAASLNIPSDTLATLIDSIQDSANGFSQKLIGYIPKIVEFSKGIFKSLYNFIMGLALSIFVLGCKEKLVFQLKKVLTAFTNQKTTANILKVIMIANKKLSHFLAGQTFECLIVGVACFVGMAVFDIPYAALVSMIIGVTNFIPMIGPIIGTIPCTLIIMIDSPVKALYFLIIENVVQQLESTFIYPKVVGGKLGISALWVFSSVLVLGNLFGFMGMFLGVPLFACMYTVMSEFVKNRLDRRELSGLDGEFGTR
ncbi:MAG: AI-2E family transporter [Clostridiales bacterium]|jgi:predicted PurR-regulated permease PerM|nr:AI-2E family transporter [Clostridiales bacterium]